MAIGSTSHFDHQNYYLVVGLFFFCSHIWGQFYLTRFFCSIIGIKLEFIIITYHKHTMHYMYLRSMHIACIHMKDRKEILLKSVPMLCNRQLLCIFLHLHLIYYVLDDHSKGPIIYSFDDRVSLFSRRHTTMEHFLKLLQHYNFPLLIWTICHFKHEIRQSPVTII